ncbi:fumarylacetoacetate hydrolase family protein [Poseidonibacter ostreae]|jgi:2-keto-4-pentenoate hydratase/2-oxohepta-3-ene-1,7-dioic acid hydratase in catechol pathway|uniref:FAA hydrolase family protein n=1 Tax=Poseidonibacter ostreae TaxID=2654171 RepID=A0A6L4WXH4_9BACT|nr:fumarylacetoacetate hydrolase family protein [Poseidonibacter ostreae]KAB7884806.1 FAA hydrolase family protein [Poseidonibacter ostreae]KAB7890164.1 FAA hydrolase family protein [Poseidonibacter ostreae]KAB7892589.1 FAA hydrolase family protein [Poseidonibacter ostreae]MAC83852.1 2-keto-4-pentenoate hydratase [Arcobacter sp.]|tara:strand:- start:542 stop:1156 length:615 start_codon:yes stop_codon:yes gene_type:complete
MNKILIDNKEIYPSKVFCIGRNYTEHIAELNNETPDEMVFFIKPNSSISDSLVFPKGNESCHYEAEISFVINDNKITAVGFGLDLTLREVQSKLKAKGLPWERAKSFDKASVFSEFKSFDGDINELSIQLFINDELKQDGNVSMMINKPYEIIKEANTFLSFENGDVLMSGTPKGVGEFVVGDKFLGKILYKNEVLIQKEFIVS